MRRTADSDVPTTAAAPVGAAWDGLPSRPASPPVIRAPRAADAAAAAPGKDSKAPPKAA